MINDQLEINHVEAVQKVQFFKRLLNLFLNLNLTTNVI